MTAHRFLNSFVGILILIAWISNGHPMAGCINKGSWPKNWPEELEPFRARSSSCDFFAGSQFTWYEIPLESPEEFEKVWPAVLRLKSKGAPISLRSVPNPDSLPENAPRNSAKPRVEIVCPPGVSDYTKEEDGSYTFWADWMKDIEIIDGILPHFVGKERGGLLSNPMRRWKPVRLDDPDRPTYRMLYKARVELTLYIDGEVIDPDRIIFPPDIPIKDHRLLEEEGQAKATSDSED